MLGAQTALLQEDTSLKQPGVLRPVASWEPTTASDVEAELLLPVSHLSKSHRF